MIARPTSGCRLALIPVLLGIAGCAGTPAGTGAAGANPASTLAPTSLEATPPESDSSAATVAELDPMFGHSFTIEARALGAILARITNEDALEAALAPLREHLDRTAEARVTDLLAARHRPAVIAFLASPAGRAVARAELFAMLYPYHETLPQKTARFYRDESRVGDAAIAKAQELDKKIAEGASPSPSLTAILVGARLVRPEHARALDALLTTEAGEAWLQARTTAWETTAGTFARIRSQLVQDGLVTNGYGTEGDLVLPPAAYRPATDGR